MNRYQADHHPKSKDIQQPLICYQFGDGSKNEGENKMTSILQILAALPSLIKTIIELMNLVEQAMVGSGKGAEKKQTVIDAIQAVVSNDGLWDKTKNLFSGLINMAALFNFGSTGKEPVKSDVK